MGLILVNDVGWIDAALAVFNDIDFLRWAEMAWMTDHLFGPALIAEVLFVIHMMTALIVHLPTVQT